jgi:hypothetical protein
MLVHSLPVPRSLAAAAVKNPRERDSLAAVLSLRLYRQGTSDMSERNGQFGRGDAEEIAVPALAGMRYLARTSPPIPDAAMLEAHRLIEANTENTRH